MSAEEAAGHRAQDDSPNTADVSYAQMMIVHHAQALEMTALAPGRAGSAAVKGLAERIAAAQKPEIEMMRDWLTSHGKPQRAQGHSGHAAMPGMATDAQLAAQSMSVDDLAECDQRVGVGRCGQRMLFFLDDLENDLAVGAGGSGVDDRADRLRGAALLADDAPKVFTRDLELEHGCRVPLRLFHLNGIRVIHKSLCQEFN